MGLNCICPLDDTALLIDIDRRAWRGSTSSLTRRGRGDSPQRAALRHNTTMMYTRPPRRGLWSLRIDRIPCHGAILAAIERVEARHVVLVELEVV